MLFLSFSAVYAQNPTQNSKNPEIGAVSRATGHLFREGLTAGFSTDSPKKQTAQGNENGLLTSVETGAYPSDVWSGLSEQGLSTLLTSLVPNPNFPITLTIARRLLLSDAIWPDSEELQALRLEKMIAFGAAPEAARLYNHWTPETPSGRLLRAGVMALIISGQPSVACLEVSANPETLIKDQSSRTMADDLMIFCNTLLARQASFTPTSEKQSDSLKKDSSSAVSKLYGPFLPASSTLDHADLFNATAPVFYPASVADLIYFGPLVVAVRPYLPAIRYDHLTDWTIPEDLSAETASILAQDSELPLGLRLKLFARSGDPFPPIPSAVPVKAPVPAARSKDEIWAVIADLYQEQWAGAAQDAVTRTNSVIGLFPHLPVKIRHLFLPTFESLKPDQMPSDSRLFPFLATLFETDSAHLQSIFPPVLAKIPTHPQPKDHNSNNAALVFLATLNGRNPENHKIPFSFSQAAQEGHINLLKIFKNLSDFLDKPPAFIDNPGEVYEKKKDLTPVNRYVIPVSTLRENLRKAKESGHIGQALLTSLLFFQSYEPRDADPDVLALLIEALIATGRMEEARQITTAVLLGVTQQKETNNGTSRPSGTTETKPASVN